MRTDRPFAVPVIPDPTDELHRVVNAQRRRAEAARRPTAAAPLDRSRDPFRLLDDSPIAETAAAARALDEGPVARALRKARAEQAAKARTLHGGMVVIGRVARFK